MEIAGVVIDRASKAEDLDAVAALEAECFTNPWTREMLEQEVQHSQVARVYVLRAEGYRVAAFCTCWLVYDELHINTIAVYYSHPEEDALVLTRTVLPETPDGGLEEGL
jgi:ribosomal protein S18 acetylase RimI-like enzyme